MHTCRKQAPLMARHLPGQLLEGQIGVVVRARASEKKMPFGIGISSVWIDPPYLSSSPSLPTLSPFRRVVATPCVHNPLLCAPTPCTWRRPRALLLTTPSTIHPRQSLTRRSLPPANTADTGPWGPLYTRRGPPTSVPGGTAWRTRCYHAACRSLPLRGRWSALSSGISPGAREVWYQMKFGEAACFGVGARRQQGPAGGSL